MMQVLVMHIVPVTQHTCIRNLPHKKQNKSVFQVFIYLKDQLNVEGERRAPHIENKVVRANMGGGVRMVAI